MPVMNGYESASLIRDAERYHQLLHSGPNSNKNAHSVRSSPCIMRVMKPLKTEIVGLTAHSLDKFDR